MVIKDYQGNSFLSSGSHSLIGLLVCGAHGGVAVLPHLQNATEGVEFLLVVVLLLSKTNSRELYFPLVWNLLSALTLAVYLINYIIMEENLVP